MVRHRPGFLILHPHLGSPYPLPCEGHHQRLVLGLRQLHDMGSGILERDDLATAGQGNWILEWPFPARCFTRSDARSRCAGEIISPRSPKLSQPKQAKRSLRWLRQGGAALCALIVPGTTVLSERVFHRVPLPASGCRVPGSDRAIIFYGNLCDHSTSLDE